MHLILLHGYLLRGTGSNIYAANIARSWSRQGHAVTVICQDLPAGDLDFVGEFIGPGKKLPASPPAEGRIRVVVPDIQGLLPVYVYDEYAGFRVKTIPDMTDVEIATHIRATASALREVALQGADLVLANHALFGPEIARRALENTGIAYNVKIHGSAIEFVLVPYPRFLPLAVSGLNGAFRIISGSDYMQGRVLEVFGFEGEKWRRSSRLEIVPPGMDPERFTLGGEFGKQAIEAGESLSRAVRITHDGRDGRKLPGFPRFESETLALELEHRGQSYNQRAPDSDLMTRWPDLDPEEPLILYIGKFLPSKGVGDLMAAAPRILENNPRSRLVFVGFGAYREHLEGLLQAMRDGSRKSFQAYASAGDFVTDASCDRWFRHLNPGEARRIIVTGYLDHAALAPLIPLASLAIVPSKLAEAFGMVAVEAMASGVLPLCSSHSGLLDVIHVVAEESPELAEMMKLDSANLILTLPERIHDALCFLFPHGFHDNRKQNEVGEKLRELVVSRFSWDGIARRLIGLRG